MDTYHPHLTALDNLPEIKNKIKVLQSITHVQPQVLQSLITHTTESTVHTYNLFVKVTEALAININLTKIICSREQGESNKYITQVCSCIGI